MAEDDTMLDIDGNYYSNMYTLGFDRSQADSFAEIAQGCWKRDGAFGSAVGGLAGFALGGSVSLGTLSVPGWVLGIVVGGVVGETKCAYKPVAAMAGHEKAKLKYEITRILNLSFLTEPFDK